MNNYYPFVNEPLPYPYNSLEPYIDCKTMTLHHQNICKLTSTSSMPCWKKILPYKN